MDGYLIIESLDPFESHDIARIYDLAGGLARADHRVTFFLVQNGVLAARPHPGANALTALADQGVEILADEFSLRERGIPVERLARGVRPAALDVVIDQLAEGRKALWH